MTKIQNSKLADDLEEMFFIPITPNLSRYFFVFSSFRAFVIGFFPAYAGQGFGHCYLRFEIYL